MAAHLRRELVNIGAYVPGSDPGIDSALKVMPQINSFLQQKQNDVTPFEETLKALADIEQGE